MLFRVSIDTDPTGLSDELQKALEAAGGTCLTNLERDDFASWIGEARPEPGRRYLYVINARAEADAEATVRSIVGPDRNIRAFPHGRVFCV